MCFPIRYEWKMTESPFLYLTTELPPPPLFKDEHHENIIPQVSCHTLERGPDVETAVIML